MKPLDWVLWVITFVGGFSAAFSPYCFLRAIWTVGPDSERWAGTGVVALFSGAVLLFVASVMWAERGRA